MGNRSDRNTRQNRSTNRRTNNRTNRPRPDRRTNAQRTTHRRTSRPSASGPNWILIGGIAGGAAVLIGAIIGAIFFFRGTSRSTSLIVEAGQDSVLEARDGTTIMIPDGDIPAGVELTLETIPKSDWPDLSEVSTTVEGVYEIDADEWGSTMEGELTIPIDLDEYTSEELENMFISYYNNGFWIELPTTIDYEESTISATVTHFSSFMKAIFRGGNAKPNISVTASPSVISGVSLPDMQSGELGEITLDISTNDPEGEPVYLFMQIGFDTLFTDFRNTAVKSMAFIKTSVEVTLIAAEGLELISTPVEDLPSLYAKAAFHIPWQSFEFNTEEMQYTYNGEELMYIPPYAVGSHQVTINLNEIFAGINQDRNEDTPITNVHIYLYAFDSNEFKPIEKKITIPITGAHLPVVSEIHNPGTGANVVCPPQPDFFWGLEDYTVDIRTLAIWLTKGDRIKGSPDYKETDKDGSIFTVKWTPDELLDEGYYSLQIGYSQKFNDKKFNDVTESTKSSVYHFTVDPTMTGTECVDVPIEPTEEQQQQVDDGVEGMVVPKSELPEGSDDTQPEVAAGSSGVTINNSTDTPVCGVYIVNPSSETWGENLLEGRLRPSDSTIIEMSPGEYSIGLFDCDNNMVYAPQTSFILSENSITSIDFEKVDVVFNLQNHSVENICFVEFTAPSGREYTMQYPPISPATGVDIVLPEGNGRYSVSITSCDNNLMSSGSFNVDEYYEYPIKPSDGDIKPIFHREKDQTTIIMKETFFQEYLDVVSETFNDPASPLQITKDPTIQFEDGYILIKGRFSYEDYNNTEGSIEVRPYESGGAIQIELERIALGAIVVQADIQEVEDMLNEAFAEIFSEMFGSNGIERITVDNGLMVIVTLPMCDDYLPEGRTNTALNCLPIEILDAFNELYQELTQTDEVVVSNPESICTELPSLVGMKYGTAWETLSNKGFQVKHEYITKGVSIKDTFLVSYQKPDTGECFDNPENVLVVLYQYKPTDEEMEACKYNYVPDLVGMSYSKADNFLSDINAKFFPEDLPNNLYFQNNSEFYDSYVVFTLPGYGACVNPEDYVIPYLVP